MHVCTVVLGSTSVMASKLGTAVLSRDVLSPESNYDGASLVRAADLCLSMDKVPPPPEDVPEKGHGVAGGRMLRAEASDQHIDTQLSALTTLLPHSPGPLMDNFRWHLDGAKGCPLNCKALHLNVSGRSLNLL